MNPPRRMLTATLLSLVLACSACAGSAATPTSVPPTDEPAPTATARPTALPTRTSTPTPTPVPPTMVTTARVDVYAAPGDETPRGYLLPGRLFRIVATEGEWARIGPAEASADAEELWVKQGSAFKPLSKAEFVTLEKVDGYDAPGGARNGYIAPGKRFTIMEEQDGFLHVQLLEGAKGWIRASATAYALVGASTPIPPTATPTGTPGPVKRAEDALLTVVDLPRGYVQAWRRLEAKADGRLVASNSFFKVDGSPNVTIGTDITVAEKPFGSDGLPQRADVVQAPAVGQGSQAYRGTVDGKPLVGLDFFKGNTVVQLTLSGDGQDVSVETAASLAETIAARLPDLLPPPAPLAMPEPLDQATFARYFRSVGLGKGGDYGAECTPGNTFPAGTRAICIALQVIEQVPQYTMGWYDRASGRCFRKYTYLGAMMPTTWTLFRPIDDLAPGEYEIRLAIKDVLVAVLPFSVQ